MNLPILVTALILAGLAAGPRAARAEAPVDTAALLKRPAAELYPAILRDYRRYAETLWRPAEGQPGMGYWGSGRGDGGNEGVRAQVNTALVYATLHSTGDRDVPVADRVEPALRYAAAIYQGGRAKGTDGKQWGGSWQSAMWAGNLGLAAFLTRDALEPKTLDAVKRVVAAEADRFVGKAPPDYVPGDTKAEENGWDLAAPAAALLLMPDDARAAAWREAATRYAFNTLSVKADQASERVVDGRPLNAWVTTANLFPDFTLENHGFFHPIYAMVSAAELGQAAMMLKLGGMNVPGAFRHNVLPEWETLKYVVLPDAEWIYPQGLDWALHDYEHIHYFAMLSTMYRRPEAALLEQRLAAYARRRQLLNGDGRLVGEMTDIGFAREAVGAERVAVSLLEHRAFGPAPAAKASAWEALVRGLKPVRVFDEAGFAVHRTKRALNSFAWKNRLMGLTVPDASRHLGQPYVTTPLTESLVGRFDVQTADGTKTKGTVDVRDVTVHARPDAFAVFAEAAMNEGRLQQLMAVASFPTGSMVYVDHVVANADVTVTEARGMPVGIQNDPVSGNMVRVAWEGGSRDFRGGVAGDTPIPGTWANIDGRLGVISPRGPMVYRAAGEANRPGAREDILFGSLDRKLRAFKKRDEVASRGIILLPNATAAETARVAASARLDRGDVGTSVSFRDIDGAERLVSVQDYGDLYVPGVTPEPK